MKKFITYTLCLLLCVVTLGLTACGKSKKEVVDTSIATNGNGGMVVTRGDYVYFVNGYNAYSVIEKNNLDKKFDIGGLYRAKLNSNGELSYEENGSVSGAEKISSKLVGFESTSLYVFGNYIYYATPVAEVDKNGELETSRIQFNRVDIDGKNSKTIYKSKGDASEVDFEFYYANGTVYLMVNENGTLKRITATNKVTVSEVATDITSLVLHRDTDDIFESDTYKNIFYTKTNKDGKVEIYNYNIVSDREEYKKTTDYTSCELLDYKFGHLYYKVTGNDVSSYTYFYRVDATKNAITSLDTEKLNKDRSYTNIYLLENETDGYIAIGDEITYYLSYSAGEVSDPLPISTDSALEIIAVRNGYIYIKQDNDIKRINIHNLKTSGNITQETVVTIEDMKTYDYDIDDNNLYVYATQGSNTYLYSVKVSNVVEGEEFEKRLLGVYNQGDEPTEE